MNVRAFQSSVLNQSIECFLFEYSDLSNKSTGTFINSSRKFPVVRKFFSPNMTLTPLNRHVKELQCMGELYFAISLCSDLLFHEISPVLSLDFCCGTLITFGTLI